MGTIAIRGKVTSQDVPLPRPCRQMEADDVGPKFLDGLHRKIRRRTVEDCHSAVVSARRVCCNDAVPT